MARTNLISLFQDFSNNSGGPAVVQTRGYRRESRTYAELSAKALFCSQALESHGIDSGDRVLLWGANSAEWVACFWGILLRGAIAVPMDASANVEFVRHTVQQSGVKLILRDRQLPEISGGPPSLVIEDLRTAPDTPELPASPLSSQNKSAVPHPGNHSSRSDIVEILFTSGTTAEPRGVVLTHGNFLANLEPVERGIQAYRKYERLMHPLRFVSLVPLSHVFGQFMGLFIPPLLRATVVFENSANPAEILRTLKRERATVLIAVPRMLDLVRGALEREIDARGWRSWFDQNSSTAEKNSFIRRAWQFRRIHRLLGFRFWAFISGGAALGNDTELFFKRLGFAVVQGYGMTETASLISLNHPLSATEGSVGKILPGREFKLAEDGEILVRGENVSSGYWKNGAVNQAAQENDGWLRTGDLGELDSKGNLKFRGRKKNVVVTAAGLNIYPEDLESALKRQPSIRDAVVIPIERKGSAEPCAVLLLGEPIEGVAHLGGAPNEKSAQVANGSTSYAAAEAVTAANAHLADYQKIRIWFVWPEPDFPRTPTGKPRLSIIANRAAKLLSPDEQQAYLGNRSALLIADDSQTDPFTRFLDRTSTPHASSPGLNSLSSLDRVELLSALEHRYNIEINESDFSSTQTAADLQTLIEQSTGPQHHVGKTRDQYQYPRWTQREPARLARLAIYYALVWPATQFLGHPRILGREHLQDVKGPVIVISNHITRRADIGLILAALPARFRHRLTTAMGGESLLRMRNPPREWFSAKRWSYQFGYFLVTLLFNVFPLPQFSGFRQSFRFAGESVDRNYSVLIFPEGEVNNSDDGKMAPFRSGIGLLAKNLALPIIPMRLDGVWRMKKEHRRFAHREEITVHIGAPLTFSLDTPPEEIASRLQIAVLKL